MVGSWLSFQSLRSSVLILHLWSYHKETESGARMPLNPGCSGDTARCRQAVSFLISRSLATRRRCCVTKWESGGTTYFHSAGGSRCMDCKSGSPFLHCQSARSSALAFLSLLFNRHSTFNSRSTLSFPSNKALRLNRSDSVVTALYHVCVLCHRLANGVS